MDISRDVVSDLWPLYKTGEASEATRQLVDRFLERDPEFASMLTRLETQQIEAATNAWDSNSTEAESLIRVKKALGRRDLLLGLAIFLSLLPFTVYKTSWGSGWLMNDQPIIAAMIAACAAYAWGAYMLLRRRLRSSKY